MGLSQSAYSKLENSERELDTQTKSMACTALDMSVEEYDRFDPRHVFHISNFNNQNVNSGVIYDYHNSQEYRKELLTSKDETIEQQKQIIKIQADEILTLKSLISFIENKELKIQPNFNDFFCRDIKTIINNLKIEKRNFCYQDDSSYSSLTKPIYFFKNRN